jgi:cellulose synthase/poly-beta-1,6-N-acetylglucosamine synthase-like glycosyltransferase
VLIVSGAFGVFRKEAVIRAGGYRAGSMGEDMELILRLHRVFREAGTPYAIHFIPDPICWTEAPERLSVLKSQRIRWQRGLAESLSLNRGLFLSRRGGAPGHLAYPFFLVFECFGPVIEVAGYAFMATLAMLGQISGTAFVAFLGLAIGMGFLLSVSALLLEEISFHLYPRAGHLARLALAAAIENLGYRQLIAFWRLVGLVRFLRGKEAKWGDMERKGAWQKS